MAKSHRLVRLGGKATITTVYLLYFFVVINGTVTKKINIDHHWPSEAECVKVAEGGALLEIRQQLK
jgi:hypothetical protein